MNNEYILILSNVLSYNIITYYNTIRIYFMNIISFYNNTFDGKTPRTNSKTLVK